MEELRRTGSLVTAADREDAAALLASAGAKQALRDRRLGALTERERNVLEQVSNGASATDIARQECVSLATVRTHVRSILQ